MVDLFAATNIDDTFKLTHYRRGTLATRVRSSIFSRKPESRRLSG
jgi:hypothetical protein